MTTTSTTPSTLWYTRCPVPSAAGIAIRTGALAAEFAPEGRSVLSLAAAPEANAHESHFDHSRPNSFRQGGNIPALWTRSRGAATRLLGLSWTPSTGRIVVANDSDIRTVSDLRGRRVGLSHRINDKIDFLRATSLHAFDNALGTAELTLDDVELTDVEVAEKFIADGPESTGAQAQLWDAGVEVRMSYPMIAALIRGEVDAIYLSGPHGLTFQSFLAARPIIDLGALGDRTLQINNLTPTTLTVSAELAAAEPETVARYLAELLRAARAARQDPDTARRIVAGEVGVAEEWIDRAGIDLAGGALDISLDEDLTALLDRQQQFLLRHGFIDQAIPLAEWIDPYPLARARALVLDH